MMPTEPRPVGLSLATVLFATVVLVGLSDVGCGERRRESDRRAESRRQAAAGAPLTLRTSASMHNAALQKRLANALAAGTPPVQVHRTIQPDEAAFDGLAAGRADLVLITGEPDPAHAPPLEKARRHARVLVLGADVVAVLANVSNRSSRVDLDDLAKVLGGRATSWQDLRGDTLPLVPYTLGEQADLTRFLVASLLGNAPLSPAVRQVDDPETQIESTRRTPGGLALVAIHRLDADQPLPQAVKPLPVAIRADAPGILPTDQAAVSRGDYPLRLPLVALVRKGSDPVARHLASSLLRAPASRRQAWLGLPGLPASDRERIRRAWAGEGPSGPIALPR